MCKEGKFGYKIQNRTTAEGITTALRQKTKPPTRSREVLFWHIYAKCDTQKPNSENTIAAGVVLVGKTEGLRGIRGLPASVRMGIFGRSAVIR